MKATGQKLLLTLAGVSLANLRKRQSSIKDDLNQSEKTLHLIEEYKVCHNRIGRFDDIVWKIAAVILPLSLAGIVYFGASASYSLDRLITVLLFAVGSTILMYLWLRIALEWISFQKISLHRIREIEKELGLWTYRYTKFVSANSSEREMIQADSGSKDTNVYKLLASRHKPLSYIGYTKTIRIFVATLICGWIVVLIKESLMTYCQLGSCESFFPIP